MFDRPWTALLPLLAALACATPPAPTTEPLTIRFEALELPFSSWKYRFEDCRLAIDAEYQERVRPEWEGTADTDACNRIRRAASSVPWRLLEGEHVGALTPDGFRSEITVQRADGTPLTVLIENCDAPDLAELQAAVNALVPAPLRIVLTNGESQDDWSPGTVLCR